MAMIHSKIVMIYHIFKQMMMVFRDTIGRGCVLYRHMLQNLCLCKWVCVGIAGQFVHIQIHSLTHARTHLYGASPTGLLGR